MYSSRVSIISTPNIKISHPILVTSICLINTCYPLYQYVLQLQSTKSYTLSYLFSIILFIESVLSLDSLTGLPLEIRKENLCFSSLFCFYYVPLKQTPDIFPPRKPAFHRCRLNCFKTIKFCIQNPSNPCHYTVS